MDIVKRGLRLSDGSMVFNVWLQDGGERIVLQAVTERDADALGIKLKEAIEAHSNHFVTIRGGL